MSMSVNNDKTLLNDSEVMQEILCFGMHTIKYALNYTITLERILMDLLGIKNEEIRKKLHIKKKVVYGNMLKTVGCLDGEYDEWDYNNSCIRNYYLFHCMAGTLPGIQPNKKISDPLLKDLKQCPITSIGLNARRLLELYVQLFFLVTTE